LLTIRDYLVCAQNSCHEEKCPGSERQDDKGKQKEGSKMISEYYRLQFSYLCPSTDKIQLYCI
jgi:hypothetical protein